MNALLILVVRLLIGISLGILIMRIFRPDWGFTGGIGMGAAMVAVVYILHLFKKNKKE